MDGQRETANTNVSKAVDKLRKMKVELEGKINQLSAAVLEKDASIEKCNRAVREQVWPVYFAVLFLLLRTW